MDRPCSAAQQHGNSKPLAAAKPPLLQRAEPPCCRPTLPRCCHPAQVITSGTLLNLSHAIAVLLIGM